jgi:hypothetical protein
MKGSSVTLSLGILLFACATAVSGQEPLPISSPFAEAAAAAGGIATSFDVDGVPTFIWGGGQLVEPGVAPDISARQLLLQFARAFNTSSNDLAGAARAAPRGAVRRLHRALPAAHRGH